MNQTGYSVQLKDDFIDVLWRGRITKEMARDCNREIAAAAKALVEQNKPVLLRASVVDPPLPPNTDAFVEALNTLKSGIPFTRLVAWGKLPRLVHTLVDVMIDSYKVEFSMRYIEDEQEALSWLRTGVTPQSTKHSR